MLQCDVTEYAMRHFFTSVREFSVVLNNICSTSIHSISRYLLASEDVRSPGLSAQHSGSSVFMSISCLLNPVLDYVLHIHKVI